MTPANQKCGCGGGRAQVPIVDSAWTVGDTLGALRVRLGFGRDDYRVVPGLVALGRPEAASPVFVTANYKLSFDHLRRALAGMDAWLLVLDTKGVNVWCAAAKGTFSTAELCRQIEATALAAIVSHRRLVLPQLGAPGVAAHEVTKATGFRVEFGPVRAADLPRWLANGRKKDAAMRTMQFGWRDRLTLVPVEIYNALRLSPVLIAIALALAGVRAWRLGSGFGGLASGYLIELFGTVVVAGVLAPMLLPWLPTKAFSVKGAVVGLAWSAAMILAARGGAPAWFGSGFAGGFTLAGAALLVTGFAAFITLNFTGATVFTSQSGTMLETKRALPLIGGVAAVGVVLQVVGAVTGESL